MSIEPGEPAVDRRPAGRREAGRTDARQKATGATTYVADVSLPEMLFAAVARSSVAFARIRGIDTSAARGAEGVVGVFTAADVTAVPYGRAVRDIPVLARERVHYVGERVAAVVATSRLFAERAAAMIDIDYEELPAVTTPEAAIVPDAPLVHDAPWDFPRAYVKREDGHNLQSLVTVGLPDPVEKALANSIYVVDRTYRTRAVHQGYLEPQACIAHWDADSRLHIWLTSKSPYRLRSQIADCLEIDQSRIEIEPIALGGDFGGKGSPMDAPLCAELARLTGRPVKLVLRYSEDLVGTESRHPATFRVRVGCDADGHLTALAQEVLLDGGAYAGYKPSELASVHGAVEAGGYRIPAFYAEARTTYTHTLPKGHMRAPGSPQTNFAQESALDELALAAGLDPVELRRRNLLVTGETDANGHSWVEFRGGETLEAAVAAIRAPAAPAGWLVGRGMSIYCRPTSTGTQSSLCIVPIAGGRLRVEVPVVETGTGSHTVYRELIGRELDYEPDEIDVVQVSTDELAGDPGAGGSRVTASIALVVDAAVKAWRARLGDEPVNVTVDEKGSQPVGSYGVQVATVAVDPETGQLKVLELLSVIDVANVINPLAHQMQVDGGAAMGFGYACLEDLDEQGGQVWAANLGEFKLPSARDVPVFRTVLVPGGRGVGTANVKSIGETTTPPAAAAIANAVAAATGCRIRELPITAERVFAALSERGA
jgi:CO/xanthine dehydrogenase Mo-binding subunit